MKKISTSSCIGLLERVAKIQVTRVKPYTKYRNISACRSWEIYYCYTTFITSSLKTWKRGTCWVDVPFKYTQIITLFRKLKVTQHTETYIETRSISISPLYDMTIKGLSVVRLVHNICSAYLETIILYWSSYTSTKSTKVSNRKTVRRHQTQKTLWNLWKHETETSQIHNKDNRIKYYYM